MSSVILVRHGQASFGKADYDQLSDLGYEQARHLGRVLREREEALTDRLSALELAAHRWVRRCGARRLRQVVPCENARGGVGQTVASSLADAEESPGSTGHGAR